MIYCSDVIYRVSRSLTTVDAVSRCVGGRSVVVGILSLGFRLFSPLRTLSNASMVFSWGSNITTAGLLLLLLLLSPLVGTLLLANLVLAFLDAFFANIATISLLLPLAPVLFLLPTFCWTAIVSLLSIAAAAFTCARVSKPGGIDAVATLLGVPTTCALLPLFSLSRPLPRPPVALTRALRSGSFYAVGIAAFRFR